MIALLGPKPPWWQPIRLIRWHRLRRTYCKLVGQALAYEFLAKMAATQTVVADAPGKRKGGAN